MEWQELAHKDFSVERAKALYQEYLDGKKEVLPQVLESIVPLVFMIIQERFYNLSDFDRDDVYSITVHKMYEALKAGAIPHQSFYYYLRTSIRHTILDCLPLLRQEVFPAEAASISKRFRTQRDAENSMFLHEIVGLMRTDISAHIRFSGKTRDACLYVLDRLISQQRVVPLVLKNTYEVPPQFITDYVIVLCRSYLHRVRHRYESYLTEKNPISFVFEAQ